MRACISGRTRCLEACAASSGGDGDGGTGVEGSLLAFNRELTMGTCHQQPGRTVIARALVPRYVLSITNSSSRPSSIHQHGVDLE
jgi:hypothetical protein